MKVRLNTNILITVSLEENKWHEVAEINVIFGKTTAIITNHSYRKGFGDREESTDIITLEKHPELNPCVLCEDVYNELKKNLEETDDEDDIVQIICQTIQKLNKA
jgi:hypothetical protein